MTSTSSQQDEEQQQMNGSSNNDDGQQETFARSATASCDWRDSDGDPLKDSLRNNNPQFTRSATEVIPTAAERRRRSQEELEQQQRRSLDDNSLGNSTKDDSAMGGSSGGRRGRTMNNSSRRQGVERTLTGDLDDIVTSVARRAGRRKPRADKVSKSPVRRKKSSPGSGSPQQERVPRRARTRSPPSDRGRSGGGAGGGSGGTTTRLSPARVKSDDSCVSIQSSASTASRGGGGGGSNLRRQSTIDSRNRFIKMLDDRTLTGFRSNNESTVENKPKTYISRLYVTFQDCLKQLNAKDVTDRKLEFMAILIHECMSGDSRNYHSVQHVFEISKDFTDDPIAVLAAMFHDCIYYNVDGGLSTQQEEALKGCFQIEEDDNSKSGGGGGGGPGGGYTASHKTCRAHMACAKDPALCMVESIFGFDHGEEVTAQKGLNEFLSAVVAVRQLKPHITDAQCAEIAACIMATIPFKHKPVEGKKTHMESLYENMEKTNIYFGLGMSDEELVKSVQVAAKVANADVGNFGSDDIYYFLDNTWSLLTETNTTLRRSFLFTVMEFQHSLFKMNGFFHFLDPAAIFATYKNDPPQEEIIKLTEQARTNLKLGQKYVGAKLLSASVLAAFAALTGGDAPLSLFVGDLPSRHHQSQSINDALPSGDKPLFHSDDDEEIHGHLDMLVYQILSGGRRSETSFDVKQSPLGAFLYAVVGDRGLTMILENKALYPMNEQNATDLLACLPREVVRYLAKTIAAVAISRADSILEVVDSLPVKVRTNGGAPETPRSEPPSTVPIAEEG